ncbi:hypothetical protein ACFV6B_29835 [Streptomyces microflavus]|uniref:hypothetical protein n=1 Tax=Streptomyces microflavus TaxID=1919 RepID=UPI0036669F56
MTQGIRQGRFVGKTSQNPARQVGPAHHVIGEAAFHHVLRVGQFSRSPAGEWLAGVRVYGRLGQADAQTVGVHAELGEVELQIGITQAHVKNGVDCYELVA